MSLSTYADLKTSVASWLKRTDLTSNIPDLIALAEAKIARDLRLRKQLTQTTLNTVGGTRGIALPADWLEFSYVSLSTDNPTPISFATVEHINARYPETFDGQPVVFSIKADTIIFGPVPDAVYPISVSYYAKFPALSADGDTNWLLTNYPSIYLFGTLCEATPFIVDDQRTVMWEGKYNKDMNELRDSDKAAQFSGSALRVRNINRGY